MSMPDLITMPNGEKPQPTFSADEMESRLCGLRIVMADHNIDAVLFTSYHNINYYSDFFILLFRAGHMDWWLMKKIKRLFQPIWMAASPIAEPTGII